MEHNPLSSILESLIFISDKPVSIDRFAQTVGEQYNKEDITQSLEQIKSKYQQDEYGFEIREVQGGYQFCTKSAHAEIIRKFLETKPFRLSRAAQETLAIIAYKQPVTRAEIDQIRGMDSSHLLRTLIERGIVRMAGKAEVPGRPVQYATSPRFLEIVGLNQISDLPPLTELEQLQGHTESPENLIQKGLESFMETTLTHQESIEETPLLGEIDTLIQQAGKTDTEVYESAVHAEVGRENAMAVEGFQDYAKMRKRELKKIEKEEEFLLGPEDQPRKLFQ